MRFTLALLVKFRIEFQILLIVFKIFKDLPPSYLRFLITPKPVSKYNLRSSSNSTLLSYPNVKPNATLGEPACRLSVCRVLFVTPKLLTLLRESWGLTFFKKSILYHLDYKIVFLA